VQDEEAGKEELAPLGSPEDFAKEKRSRAASAMRQGAMIRILQERFPAEWQTRPINPDGLCCGEGPDLGEDIESDGSDSDEAVEKSEQAMQAMRRQQVEEVHWRRSLAEDRKEKALRNFTVISKERLARPSGGSRSQMPAIVPITTSASSVAFQRHAAMARPPDHLRQAPPAMPLSADAWRQPPS